MVEKTPPQILKMTPTERHSKRLRQFRAAIGRYHPRFALTIEPLGSEGEVDDGTVPVLIVSGGGLDWATVDRLSDGVVQGVVYEEGELIEELLRARSVLFEAVSRGTVLLGTEEDRRQLLSGQPICEERGVPNS